MPILHFDLRGTCSLCGGRVRGGGVLQCRINRRSIRGVERGGLFFIDPRCHECGFETRSMPQVMALTEESAAQVAAYRARKWGDAA